MENVQLMQKCTRLQSEETSLTIVASRPFYIILLTSALVVNFDVKRVRCNWNKTKTWELRFYIQL